MSATRAASRALLAGALASCCGCRPYAVAVPRARAVDEAFYLRESTVGVEERGPCVLIPVPLSIGLTDVARSPFAVRYVVVPLSVDGESERARAKIVYKLSTARPTALATACEELSAERREHAPPQPRAAAPAAPADAMKRAAPYQAPAANMQPRAGFFEQPADQKQLQQLEPALLESATERARAGELSLDVSEQELNRGAVDETLFLLVRYEGGLPDAGDVVRLDLAHVSREGELSGRTILDLRRVRKPHPAAAVALGLGTIIFATAGILAATERRD